MKKLIFEDTTVIKKPFVEIDGVEYEVQDGEFEGGTDLNAQNFNQVQDNIEDYIDGKTSMGSIIVEDIECKNLFDINGNVNTQANNGSQVSKNSVSNGILTTQVNTYDEHVVGQKIEDLTGKTITFSAKVVSTGTGKYGIIYIYEDGIAKKSVQGEIQSELSTTYTCTSNNVVFAFGTNGDSASTSGKGAQFTNIQVEIGDTKTDYVEHKKMSFTINDLIKQMVNIPGDFLKSTVNVDDLYNELGVKVYSIWEQYPASMPYGAYVYGALIVITQSTTNMFLNTQIYITDGVHNTPTENTRGVYVRTGKSDWLRISGTKVSKRTVSTTSTTNNENLELTDM